MKIIEVIETRFINDDKDTLKDMANEYVQHKSDNGYKCTVYDEGNSFVVSSEISIQM